MEDAHAAILDLHDSKSTSFFAVYDGHAGANVALYCASQFHIELMHHEDYHNNLAHAVERTFFRIDEQLQQLDGWREAFKPPLVKAFNLLNCLKPPACDKGTPDTEGSTACVVLIRGNQIIVGNVGNSRCVLSRDGQAIDLSTDHKPTLAAERERIVKAGGKISRSKLPKMLLGVIVGTRLGVHRVNGILAVSRSIGSFQLKRNKDLTPEEQMVTCSPDIMTVDITDDTEFLVIASDGLWDYVSSQGAVDFVHKQLNSGIRDLRFICELLIDICMRTQDNMTMILVQFKHAPRVPPPASDVHVVPPPAGNVPVVDPAFIPSSSTNPIPAISAGGAGAKARADTCVTEITEVKEEEDKGSSGGATEEESLLPLS